MAKAETKTTVKALSELSKLSLPVEEVQQDESHEVEEEENNEDLDQIEEVEEVDEGVEVSKPVKGTGKHKKQQVQETSETASINVDEMVEVEEVNVEANAQIPLPYRKCHVCRHLMPSLPSTLSTKFGGDGKSDFGDSFDCYTEEQCPARFIQLIYFPFSDDKIAKAVEEFLNDGDLTRINEMYAKAPNYGQVVYDDLHSRIVEAVTNAKSK